MQLFLFMSLLPLVASSCGNTAICVSAKQNRLLANEVLSILGIPKRPPKQPPTAPLTYSTKFMMQIYKLLQEQGENRIKRSLPNLRQDEIRKTELSDVVISMSFVKKTSVGLKLKLEFSLDSVPKKSKLIGAELKLFQTPRQGAPGDLYVISVYRGRKITSTSYRGWISMDISQLFNSWLHNPLTRPVLYLALHSFNGFQELDPGIIGLDKEPFVMAYLQANNKVKSRPPRHLSPAQDFQTLVQTPEKCGMRTLKVSFKDLGWSDWVIAPEGYTTSFCQGSCNFPIKFPRKATHHALVQSLMHLKNPGKWPKPSCAPTDTTQLSVLYKQRENTILKNYKDMIVKGCGCL